MKKLSKILSILLVITMLLGITACSDKTNNSSGTDNSTNNTKNNSTDNSSSGDKTKNKPDIVVYGWNDDAKSLHPQIQNGSDEIPVYQIYNGLTKFDEITGDIVGDLAESWEVSEDNLTWTFKLRQGVKWQNGDDFIAEDVKATFDGPLDPNTKLKMASEYFSVFDKVEVVDDYTVKISTKEPYGPTLALLANRTTGIANRNYLAKYGDDMGSNVESTCGTGSYKIIDWKKGVELTLEKFDDFYGAKANIENVVFKVIPDAAAQVVALQNGEVDYIAKLTAENRMILDGDKNVNVFEFVSNGQTQFRFCLNDEIMKNVKVRQAISYAIDRDAIVEGLFKGMGEVSTCALAPLTFGYNNLGPIKQDVEKAKTLLKEAGYEKGFKTKVVTTPRYTKGVEMAEVIKEQLKAVNIELEVSVLEWSAFLEMIGGMSPEELDAPLMIMGCGPSMLDADGGFRGLYTTTVTGTNERNYSFYSNPDVDRLITEGMQETDLQKRLEIYKEAEQILYFDDPAAMWIYDQYRVVAADAALADSIKLSGSGLPLFYMFEFK